jgi:hypothetical protein
VTQPAGTGGGELLRDILSNHDRTTNLIRLLRWAVPALIVLAAIVAGTVIVITLASPLAGGLSGTGAAVGTGLAVRAHRRKAYRRKGVGT